MEITDRDYMRERPSNNNNPFGAPKPPRGPSVFTVVLILVGILYLVFKAAQWWQDHNTHRSSASVPQAQPVVNPLPQSVPSAYRLTQQRATTPQYGTPPVAATATKCVLNGKTSYSDGPCPSGAAVSTLRLAQQTNVALPVIHVAPTTTQAVAVQSPQVVFVQNQPAVNPFAERLAECKALEAQITQLDNEARQLLSAQRQDWIKDLRKKARDRQFGLHCQ